MFVMITLELCFTSYSRHGRPNRSTTLSFRILKTNCFSLFFFSFSELFLRMQIRSFELELVVWDSFLISLRRTIHGAWFYVFYLKWPTFYRWKCWQFAPFNDTKRSRSVKNSSNSIQKKTLKCAIEMFSSLGAGGQIPFLSTKSFFRLIVLMNLMHHAPWHSVS